MLEGTQGSNWGCTYIKCSQYGSYGPMVSPIPLFCGLRGPALHLLIIGGIAPWHNLRVCKTHSYLQLLFLGSILIITMNAPRVIYPTWMYNRACSNVFDPFLPNICYQGTDRRLPHTLNRWLVLLKLMGLGNFFKCIANGSWFWWGTIKFMLNSMTSMPSTFVNGLTCMPQWISTYI